MGIPFKPIYELASDLDLAASKYYGRRITHVKSDARYHIKFVSFREHDLEILISYTPVGEFYNQVIFTRTVAEMDFGNRFVITS